MPYASWGTRVGAYLIDTLVAVPFLVIAYLTDGLQADPDSGTTSDSGVIYLLLVLIGFLVSAYNRWVLAGRTGQSWGKKALGVSLIGERTGQPIGVGKALLRDIVHIVDGLPCYIGYLWPIWDARRQTLADKIMKTVVTRS